MIFPLILSLTALATEPKTNDQLYQLDYRERISVEAELPMIGGFEIEGSFETRYRPKKAKPTITPTDKPEALRAP